MYIEVFNIAILLWLTVEDLKHLAVPYYSTFVFFCVSLYFTSIENVIAAVFIVIALFVLTRSHIKIGNADKKITTGLALQTGAMLPLYIIIAFMVLLYGRGKLGLTKPIPLIPVILLIYLAWLSVAGIS